MTNFLKTCKGKHRRDMNCYVIAKIFFTIYKLPNVSNPLKTNNSNLFIITSQHPLSEFSRGSVSYLKSSLPN